ncbi:MAG: cytochrome c4 [Gammaproteobacteria bacterium]|nr:cytochrome c4 [Gammaproteobacteria bacterium]MBT8105173.1 cytochrome c4 [Gammaproteobacteria bacterium]NNF49819.1 cytochrome c4 [Woeseiaceae bacterium]NNK25187.1 cytochrome c4 [Woeseiaceae bacterium]NNL64062.1 cytochrome c4 [Woeseiaceae bacterium]
MNKKFAPLFAMAGLTMMAATAQADSLVAGSAQAGKAKSITCVACHGPEGISVVSTWPSLAGQGAPYLLAQLKAFKDGSRMDPVMSAQAMMIADEDMADIAVYFESLSGAVQTVADPDSVDRAEALYRGGNAENGTAACIACHGPSGRGNPAAGYPALQGQHAVYTAKQLNDYASGTRATDGKTRVMRDIAAKLSPEDIEALSSYVQGLR